jgi:hypothetical protein
MVLALADPAALFFFLRAGCSSETGTVGPRMAEGGALFPDSQMR